MRNLVFLFTFSFIFACDTTPKIDTMKANTFAAKWSKQVESDLAKRAGGEVVSKALGDLLEVSAEAEKSTDSKLPPYAQLVHDVYSGREFKPIFVQQGVLKSHGKLAWKVLQNIENHALDPNHYHLKEIEADLKAMEALASDSSADELKPNADDIAGIEKWLTTQTEKDLPLTEVSFPKLTDHLLSTEAGARIQKTVDRLNKLSEKVGQTSARVEANLAIDLARFVHMTRFQKDRKIFVHPRQDDAFYEMGKASKRPDDQRGKLRGGFVWRQARARAEEMADWTELRYEGIRQTLRDFAQSEKPRVSMLYTPHPQYVKLVRAYTKYKGILKKGKAKVIQPKKGLKKGSKDKTVLELKNRLQLEGFYPAKTTPDNKYDEALVIAIKDYQTTHQMKVTGTPHKTFWKSINIPLERRTKQIAVNLDRLRTTNLRHEKDNLYVYINVPDFHAEVWDKQERKMRFRVVVGNNNRVKDEESGKWERANRTPTPLAAVIDRVIYNPYWNVTARVRTGEIVKKVNKALTEEWEAAKAKAVEEGKDPATVSHPYLNKETGEIDAVRTKKGQVPAWYAQHGYEVVGAGRGYEYVRQIPGGGNALGKVKVIFPNLHDVYMHDTPKKRLFKEPVRAFSHGCMRMHNPLDFAEYVLRTNGLYKDADVPTLLKKRKPTPIFLNKMIPVFVEYYTIRVDDEERVHFLADVYDYDDAPIAKIK